MTANRPSKEAREALVKGVNQVAEKIKGDVRGLRKESLDKLKNLKKKASDDDIKRLSKQVEAITEVNLAKVAQMVKDKTAEILG